MRRVRQLPLLCLTLALSACGTQADPLLTQGRKPSNAPPVVTTFTASPGSGSAPLTVTFTAQASDANRDTLSCLLDANGDGTTDVNLGDCRAAKSAAYTFPAGSYTAKLSVSDGKGGSAAATKAVTVNTAPPPPAASTWVMGYYVGYLSSVMPPESVDYSAMTHVMVGVSTPNSDGSLNLHFDLDSVQGPAWAKKTVQLAHQNGRKAILMLGGSWTGAAFASAASSSNRARFVSNILATLDSYGFDGVDLDWEPISAADEPLLKALASDLRAQRPDLILTLPVGFFNTNFPADVRPFYAEVAPLFDRLNLMTYAMNGAYDGWWSWHSSALYGEKPNTPTSVSSSVNALRSLNIPAAKIGVGTGFFGSCYQRVTGPNQPVVSGDLVADDNDMSYVNIINQYNSDPARVLRDPTAQVPYLSFSAPTGPKGCTFVTYEDETSIAAKAQYVKQNGLGGTIIWNINEGHFPNRPAGQQDPLLSAVKLHFLP